MPLDDLRRQRLLVPEDLWGPQPRPVRRIDLASLGAGVLAAVSAVLVWMGAGSTLTFVGLGLFFADLAALLLITFWSVETQVQRLVDMGLAGKIDGLE